MGRCQYRTYTDMSISSCKYQLTIFMIYITCQSVCHWNSVINGFQCNYRQMTTVIPLAVTHIMCTVFMYIHNNVDT